VIVKAVAYASTANIGPGFDVFGISLDVGFDTVEARLIEKDVLIEVTGIGASFISRVPSMNTAGLVAEKALKDYDIEGGIGLKIHKGIRPGSGLGSSAASASATAVALSRLFNLNISKQELVKLASIGEIASAGVAHADNVAPSILGGFTIVRSYNPFDIMVVQPPEDLAFCIALPEIVCSTRTARSVLPKEFPIRDVISNLGNASSLVAGMLLRDLKLVGRSMEDRVAEPYRSKLIPGYDAVKRYAKEAGALGVAISGSGPSIIALIDSKESSGKEVREAMKNGFSEAGVRCETFLAKPARGAETVEVN
jgi:homoserine kinase